MRSRALNIVIKLASVDGAPCVKLSDDPSKASPAPFPPFLPYPFISLVLCLHTRCADRVDGGRAEYRGPGDGRARQGAVWFAVVAGRPWNLCFYARKSTSALASGGARVLDDVNCRCCCCCCCCCAITLYPALVRGPRGFNRWKVLYDVVSTVCASCPHARTSRAETSGGL